MRRKLLALALGFGLTIGMAGAARAEAGLYGEIVQIAGAEIVLVADQGGGVWEVHVVDASPPVDSGAIRMYEDIAPGNVILAWVSDEAGVLKAHSIEVGNHVQNDGAFETQEFYGRFETNLHDDEANGTVGGLMEAQGGHNGGDDD